MKIQRGLPQFAGVRALLVVTGWRSGVCYIAEEGVIRRAGGYEVPIPKFSDNEALVPKAQKHYILEQTLKALRHLVKDIVTHELPAEVYVYAPAPLMTQTKDVVLTIAKDTYKNSYRGDYTRSHEFDLLSMIKLRKERKVIKTIPESARKLLKKT